VRERLEHDLDRRAPRAWASDCVADPTDLSGQTAELLAEGANIAGRGGEIPRADLHASPARHLDTEDLAAGLRAPERDATRQTR
jgi:hypothetical protein